MHCVCIKIKGIGGRFRTFLVPCDNKREHRGKTHRNLTHQDVQAKAVVLDLRRDDRGGGEMKEKRKEREREYRGISVALCFSDQYRNSACLCTMCVLTYLLIGVAPIQY